MAKKKTAKKSIQGKTKRPSSRNPVPPPIPPIPPEDPFPDPSPDMSEGEQIKWRQRAFLHAYSLCGNLSQAGRMTRICRNNHVNWMKEPEYVKAFEVAKEEAKDLLLEEARRRAEVGVCNLKFHNGEAVIDPRTGQVYEEHSFSDSLMMFLLKQADPSFRDASSVYVDGKMKHSGSLQHDHTVTSIPIDSLDLPLETRVAILEAIRKKRESSNESPKADSDASNTDGSPIPG